MRDAFSLLSLFVASGEALQHYSARARLQTDNHNRLEFSAPRGLYETSRSTNENARNLRALSNRFTPPPGNPVGDGVGDSSGVAQTGV